MSGDVDNIAKLATFRPRHSRAKGAVAKKDSRPRISIESDNLEAVVNQAQAALISSDRGLYQRGCRIVYVGAVKSITADGREIETPRIFERGDHALYEDISASAIFEKWDSRSQSPKTVEPPQRLAKVLQERGPRLLFPVLTAVINAPTLRADGSILDVPGYDAATGLLYDPAGSAFEKVPDEPTRDDAERSLEKLRRLVENFPFVADADRSVSLSAMMTAVIRRSLPTAPLHGFTATAAGTGKSKLTDLTSVISTGREAAVLAQGRTEEETEKRLASVLLAGDPIVAIDNVESALGGDLMCQMTTQKSVRVRILGRSETVEVPTSSFLVATGNAMVFVGDMSRRALLCRMDAKVERPELRKFNCDPVDVAKGDRSALVLAILTILRAFIVAGRPRQCDPLGGFVEWSDLVRGALIWLGCTDPADTMEIVRRNDPLLIGRRTVVAQWKLAVGFNRTSVSNAIRIATAKATPIGADNDVFINPNFREALMIAAGERGVISSVRLGRWLSKNADVIVSVPSDGGEHPPPAQYHFHRDGILDGSQMWRLVEKQTE